MSVQELNNYVFVLIKIYLPIRNTYKYFLFQISKKKIYGDLEDKINKRIDFLQKAHFVNRDEITYEILENIDELEYEDYKLKF
jgi:hypothetical protein